MFACVCLYVCVFACVLYCMPHNTDSPNFPAVVKVGHGQAGFGKMIIQDHHQFEDFKSVMAMSDKYCTAEEFLVRV